MSSRGVDPPGAQRRFRAARKVIMDALKDLPCMDCGRAFPPECMDYDHRPGEIKVANVSWMKGRRWERVLAEIAKCDLICANCHRIRTKKREEVES